MIDQTSQDLVKHLKENLTLALSNKLLFGDPVTLNNRIIVPVAKLRIGFGFGWGKSKKADQNGEGGGGGISASPIGYIEMNEDGSSQFIRIHSSSIPLFFKYLAGGYVLWKLIKKFIK